MDRPPKVLIKLDAEIIENSVVSAMHNVKITRFLETGQHILTIEMYDKSDIDAHQHLRISNLSFGKIQSPRFVWQGIYRPQYPEPWASQQLQQGMALPVQLRDTDCLGWNGVWSLGFSVPIFTWIHQIENLGWIYD
jgi:hypothetical protein